MTERILQPISELYSGRTGLLVKYASPHYLEAILDYLYEKVDGWDTFQCTLVDGSASCQLFSNVIEKRNNLVRSSDRQLSPYIDLSANFENYMSGLPKSFRENLKKSQRRLAKMGAISIRHYQEPDELNNFFSAVLSIEHLSWKESAGTSITTNQHQEALYRQFLLLAVERGWLMGTVLSLENKPIAYAMGFVFENIYYNEKASYDESMKATGAGSYIYYPIIEALYRRGVQTFDFMGKCEEYKMRWTQSTYSRSTWTLYNDSIRGRLVQLKHSLGNALHRNSA